MRFKTYRQLKIKRKKKDKAVLDFFANRKQFRSDEPKSKYHQKFNYRFVIKINKAIQRTRIYCRTNSEGDKILS